MTDVRLYQTEDGGGITIVNGQPELSEDGIESAVYLSLVGGNVRDSALESDRTQQWWGNFSETDPAKQYRSELQNLLATIPIVPANLKRFEDAALRDVAWMTDGVVESITTTARMPALSALALQVEMIVSGKRRSYMFSFSPLQIGG